MSDPTPTPETEQAPPPPFSQLTKNTALALAARLIVAAASIEPIDVEALVAAAEVRIGDDS